MAGGVRRVCERGVLWTRVQRRRSHQCGGEPDAPEDSHDAVTQSTLHTARIQPGLRKTRDQLGDPVSSITNRAGAGSRRERQNASAASPLLTHRLLTVVHR